MSGTEPQSLFTFISKSTFFKLSLYLQKEASNEWVSPLSIKYAFYYLLRAILSITSVSSYRHKSSTNTKRQYECCTNKIVNRESLSPFCIQHWWTVADKEMSIFLCTLIFGLNEQHERQMHLKNIWNWICLTLKRRSERKRSLKQVAKLAWFIHSASLWLYTHSWEAGTATVFPSPLLNHSETIKEKANWLTDS